MFERSFTLNTRLLNNLPYTYQCLPIQFLIAKSETAIFAFFVVSLQFSIILIFSMVIFHRHTEHLIWSIIIKRMLKHCKNALANCNHLYLKCHPANSWLAQDWVDDLDEFSPCCSLLSITLCSYFHIVCVFYLYFSINSKLPWANKPYHIMLYANDLNFYCRCFQIATSPHSIFARY